MIGMVLTSVNSHPAQAKGILRQRRCMRNQGQMEIQKTETQEKETGKIGTAEDGTAGDGIAGDRTAEGGNTEEWGKRRRRR